MSWLSWSDFVAGSNGFTLGVIVTMIAVWVAVTALRKQKERLEKEAAARRQQNLFQLHGRTLAEFIVLVAFESDKLLSQYGIDIQDFKLDRLEDLTQLRNAVLNAVSLAEEVDLGWLQSGVSRQRTVTEGMANRLLESEGFFDLAVQYAPVVWELTISLSLRPFPALKLPDHGLLDVLRTLHKERK
jgi:hypothetical protein